MEIDKLDKVALLARSQESKAASSLQRSQQVLDASSARLAQLETFRKEYEERLAQMSESGIDARQLADYRRFLANLNDAIRRQGDEVSRGEGEVRASRDFFVDRSLRRSSVDELISRGRAHEAREDDRREQRRTDESTMARYRLDP